MNAIAYRDFDLRTARAVEPRTTSARRHHGIVRRLFAAMERWAQRRAEEEAGRFIANHGGRVTDDVERQLSEHFAGRGFLPYAPPRSCRSSANLLAR